MTILLIDISYNNDIKAFQRIKAYEDYANLIITFGTALCQYTSIALLEDDFCNNQNEFFSKPCAYYDMMISVMSHLRRKNMLGSTIILDSPMIDDCSILADRSYYDDYMDRILSHDCETHPSFTYTHNTPLQKTSSSDKLYHLLNKLLPSIFTYYYDGMGSDE